MPKTNEQTVSPAAAPVNSKPYPHDLIDHLLHNLAIEEHSAAKVARLALRAQRDGELAKVRTKVEPLLYALLTSVIENDGEMDPKSGMLLFKLDYPPKTKRAARRSGKKPSRA